MKGTDNVCLGKHKTVIRDIDISSLSCKADSPGQAMKHFCSEISRIEGRYVESLLHPGRARVQVCIFTLGELVHRTRGADMRILTTLPSEFF